MSSVSARSEAGVARDVAGLHGGDLGLENRPKGGLRATLVLPHG